jgi:hypothetical protein
MIRVALSMALVAKKKKRKLRMTEKSSSASFYTLAIIFSSTRVPDLQPMRVSYQ